METQLRKYSNKGTTSYLASKQTSIQQINLMKKFPVFG